MRNQKECSHETLMLMGKEVIHDKYIYECYDCGELFAFAEPIESNKQLDNIDEKNK